MGNNEKLQEVKMQVAVGEEKYREIYLNNPRVTGFVSYEEFKSDNYDEVYCGIYNQTTEEMKYMRIK